MKDINVNELRRLDLNLLLTFATLMHERSVGRTADYLHVGQSAVSMALARLRDSLGDDLFVRAGGAMQPTPFASALWRELEPALASVQSAVRSSRTPFEPATAEMIVRFAAPDDLEFVLIPALLERLAVEAPRVRLAVRPSDFRTLLDRLDTGDADLALSATPTKGIERRHMVQPLHREGFAVLFDPEQVGLNDVIGLDEYLDLPHLLLSIDGELRGPIDDRLEELGRARTVLAAVSHFPTLPFILKRCRAIVNVPGIAAGYFAKAYDLRVCSLPIEIEDFEVSLIWHSRTHQDAASRWFRGLVADLVSELRSGMSLPRGGEREAARRASG